MPRLYVIGRRWPPRIRPLPACVTLPSLLQIKRYYSVSTDICQRNLIPCVLPFKVTPGRCNRHGSISYPSLPINGPLWPWAYMSRTVSEINGDFSWKSQIFPTLCILTPSLRAFLLKFGNSTWVSDRERSLTVSLTIWIQYTSVKDRRTNRHQSPADS